MREILFRGKNEAGIWHYGAYLPYESGEVAILESFSKYGYEAVELSRRCKVIPETVGQYTGLTDKNGKKIFEGDIVTTPYYGIEFQTVEWVKTSCGFEPFSDSNLNCGHCGGGVVPNFCEVVGNIYDNPELLKGGAE